MKTVLWAFFWMGLCFFFSLIVFFGGNFSYKKFQLHDGQIVECRIKYVNSGLINLNYCRDGKRYLAQKNVTALPNA